MICIYPQHGNRITVEEAYGTPETTDRTGNDQGGIRPSTALCMVTSLDGSIALSGASGGLSSATDRGVLAQLRRLADVIVVGAGTVRDEGYGPPKKHGQRIGVVTRRGDVNLASALFTSGAGFLIMPNDAPPTAVDAVRAGEGQVDLLSALRSLPGNPSRVQIEGGASLNGAFLAADLIDEINLTVSPHLVGGSGPRLSLGAPEMKTRFQLAQLCEHESYLFARYQRRYTAAANGD